MAFLQTALRHGEQFAASYKPQTAVTDWIERLCSSSYRVTEYEGVPELVESINLQFSGPGEAARALRKKLKYGNTHMQLRAIFLIKCLVENCGERTNFQKHFPDPTLIERLKIIAGDPQTDPTVKKTLLSTLKGFHSAYGDDRSLRVYATWWDEVGGARGEADERARVAYKKEQERLEKESQLRLDEKMARRLQGEEDAHAAKLREERQRRKEAKAREEAMRQKLEQEKQAAKEREEARERERQEKERQKSGKSSGIFGATSSSKPAAGGKRVPFNFEAEKPRISQAVANASMNANGLVNALQLVNREKESVASNTRVQDQLNKLKEARKQIIRYIQLCEVDKEGEYIGMLISSNEQIIAALRLYDRMLTKPAEEDSDDDEPAIKLAKQASMAQPAASPSPAPASAAAATVTASPPASSSRDEPENLSANLSNMSLNNSSRQTFGELDKLRDRQRTEILRENRSRHAAGLPTPGIYGDLAGLNFDPLQAPMNPKHAVETRDPYGQGNLSDYSDYSSSDEDDYRPSASGSGSRGDSGGYRAWKDFVNEDERRTDRNLLDPDDPFGDTAEARTPIYEKPRAHVWAEI